VQIDKKFTRKEGKPFGVVWLEDLTGTLEVVLWNEVYIQVSDALALGRVVEIKGTLDKRDDTVRATAQKMTVLAREKTHVAASDPIKSSTTAFDKAAVLIQFSSAGSNDA